MSDGPDLARVGVVIVNYRTLPELTACLAQPVLQDVGHVVVVDNASDPTAVAALCAAPRRTAILRGDNGGFAVGVNAGVSALSESVDVVWLLNPDVTVAGDVPRRLLEHLDDYDGVGPNLLEPSGRGQVGAAGGELSVLSFAIYFLFLSHLFPRLQGIFWTRSQARRGGSAAWLCMASPLLRRDCFGRFGPIPEGELVYAEDIAWGTAATERGARFAVVSELTVVHAHGASGGSRSWSGALGRLADRRLGRGRGRAARLCMRFGLGLRSLAGRGRGGASPARCGGR